MDAFFYEQELSEINREPDLLYLVEKVLQRKKARGVWEYMYNVRLSCFL